LHSHPTAQCCNAINRFIRDSFCMIKEPVQAIQRRITVHFLKDIQSTRDGFIVRGMQTPWPLVLYQYTHDLFQLRLHVLRHLWSLNAEILEVCSRKHQHLASTVMTEIIVALFVFDAGGPVKKI